MKKNDDMNLKSKSSHWQNIWNDDIGDTHPLIPITNTLNIEKYDLKNDFIVQSCNTFYHNLFFGRWWFHNIVKFYDNRWIRILKYVLKIKMKNKD
jgi:hypothetical protein